MASNNSWKNPITAERLAYGVVSLSSPRVHSGPGSPLAVYYLHSDENGHGRIKRVNESGHVFVTPDQFNVGSSINGYGGGAYTVLADGKLLFTDAATQGIYVLSQHNNEEGNVETVAVNKQAIYGDMAAHPADGHSVLAVREITLPGQKYPDTSIVRIDVRTRQVFCLCEGADFYTSPRFSVDGSKVCWLEWNRPHMPWTGARLYVATWTGSSLKDPQKVGDFEGCGQPRWCLDNSLLYAYDATGYQQLYQHTVNVEANKSDLLRITGLENRELAGAEFWLSSNTYLELDEEHMVVTSTIQAHSQLALVHRGSNSYVDLDIDLNDIAYDAMQRIDSRSFLVIGASANRPSCLYRVQLPENLDFSHGGRHGCQVEILAESFDMNTIAGATLSTPVSITFTRSAPKTPIHTGHAFLMSPSDAAQRPGQTNELPPCIIFAHGGPTKHHRPSINLDSQYFTSRGYSVVLLNHVGSTGYGSAYRDAMDGLWGVEDVQDAVDCVRSLVEAGLIDPNRVGVTGGSAGGYLTLQALCKRPDVWAGAVSTCGISDMAAFRHGSHKFESCYDHLLIQGRSSLLGVYDQDLTEHIISTLARKDDADQGDALTQLYSERSPIRNIEGLQTPVLLLQGVDDKVVTLDQATTFTEAVLRRQDHDDSSEKTLRRPLAKLVVYEQEGHGFHLAKNKQDSLLRQAKWWQETLGHEVSMKE